MKHLAFFICAATNQNGWLPFEQIRVPADDLGFRQGVTAVERLRTYAGRAFQIEGHLKRFDETLRLISINGVMPRSRLATMLQELIDRNQDVLDRVGDVGITLWATPGTRPGDPPTLAMHLNRIDHEAVSSRRSRGQTVVLTDVVQPDNRCWSRQAKVRCRLHYYLADLRAREISDDATGVLQDADGTWTESSVANIALVCDEELFWPPPANVLPGITRTHVRKLADAMGLVSRETPITTDMIRSADAMLLMGTDSGLWFASEAFGQSGETLRAWSCPEKTSVLRRLQSEW